MPETFIIPQSNNRTASESKDNQTNGLQKTQIVDAGGEAVSVTDGKLDVNAAAPVGGATSEMQDNIEGTLNQILSAISAIAHAKGVLADLRVTLIGGTTAVTGTLTAVTTVATLSNQTSIGGYLANPQVPALTNIVAVQSNINNILIS